MTKATIRMDTVTEGHVLIEGHAKDERICAAISTVAGATLNALGNAAELAAYESGRGEFRVRFTDGLQMGAFDVLVEALEMLSEKFPEEVGVTINGPDDLE